MHPVPGKQRWKGLVQAGLVVRDKSGRPNIVDKGVAISDWVVLDFEPWLVSSGLLPFIGRETDSSDEKGSDSVLEGPNDHFDNGQD
ncbi:hypothetical protein MKZ38_003927 [Zalerion maritima]|uniref:Uncharacterized protein n=1 Tax=Zalerion maritima TaxID=339359 RepID=A0AAD5WPY4_9PEZI|nr:hypothetical protein MKZ38_003927 [Zalerion maritima]